MKEDTYPVIILRNTVLSEELMEEDTHGESEQ